MIPLNVVLSNIKSIAVIALVIAVVWFYKDYKHQISENIRQTENNGQLRKYDSLKFASQILTAEEIKEYLEYENKDLKKKIAAAGIKENRIESLVTNNYYYKDTTAQVTDVSPLIKSIIEGIPAEQKFQDTTKCLTIKGGVWFDGKSLKVKIDDREFKNKSDAVAYWERRKWNFLGIKTRLFGKKVFTSKVFDECGESRIMKIEKKK